MTFRKHIMQKDIITKSDFEREFRGNYPRYFYYALSLSGDSDTAKDIVSEVFLAVWGKRKDIEKSKLGSYILRSIHNTFLKRSAAASRLPVAEGAEAALSVSDTDADEWLVREKRITEMEKVIRDMPPRTRYVLEQFYYKKRSYKDIAQELGITTDGIKKQLVKGLTILRSHFNIIKHQR